MKKIFIFGHKNPDTDAICSAIAYAHLKKRLEVDAEPVRLGEINEETKFVLKQFNASIPRLVEFASNEVESVILVDHNEQQQSVSDIKKVRILEVIDHHRVANFETSEPLYFRVEPVGCTATILNKMYKENEMEIQEDIAGLMLSAIISDTLLFRSPTCTKEDVKAAEELAKIAGIKLETYGMEMLKAGANLSGKSATELISIDSKEFQMGNFKTEIAQINVVDVNDVLSLQEEIEKEIQERIKEKALDLFFLAITDVLNSNSVVLALGEKVKVVEKAFSVSLQNHTALLEGVVSRKKQIVPSLENALVQG